MSCIETNRTPEEVRNIIRNHGVLFTPSIEDTVQDIVDRLDYTEKNLLLHHEQEDPDETFYTFFGIRIKHRVSELAKNKWRSMVGYTKAEQISNYPDNIKKRKAGIFVHELLTKMVDVFANDKGSLTEIRQDARNNNIFKITSNQISVLEKEARQVVKQINDIQNTIDPNKKAIIRTESKVIDPIANRGGSADVFALFSDMSAINYDFKVKHSHGQNYRDRQLIDDLMGTTDIDHYGLNMSEYKRIYEDRYGVKFFRQNRLHPIHIRLSPKEKPSKNDYLSTHFELIEAGSETSKFLKQIPIAGEETKYKKLNELIEEQMRIVSKLRKQQNKAGTTLLEKDRLEAKIKNLYHSVQNTIREADISDLLVSVYQVVKEAETGLAEPKYISEGKLNPNYLSDKELSELLDEANVYRTLIRNTHAYFVDLKEKNEKLYNELKERTDKIASSIENVYAGLEEEYTQRIMEDFADEDKTPEGDLKIQKELKFIDLNFSRISQIPNVVFKKVWETIQKQINRVRHYVQSVYEEVTEKDAALFKWASDNNMSRQDAFNKMINFETGNLVSKYSPEFWNKVHDARMMTNKAEGAKIIQELYEIDENKFNEKTYKEAHDHIEEIYKGKFGKDYESKLRTWEDNNNLFKSNQAWLNSNLVGRYLRIKPEVAQKYKSKEYAYIEQNKPLLDYYTMYVNYNNAFRRILEKSMSELPPNFIPNIRKEVFDYISHEKGGLKAIIGEFFDSFRVREEDVYLANLDDNGIRREIPLLFYNPLKNKNGDIDLTQKSYNLSSSLLAFAKVVKNYELMTEIEPRVLGLKSLLADKSAFEATTQSGQKIKGAIKQVATKVGFETDTYKLLEGFVDYYLYGIKFKEKSLTKGVNTTKLLTTLKQYMSKRALAFAILPSLGALIAGRTAAFFEGRKGMSYTNKMMTTAYKYMATDFNKFRKAGEFFQVFAEDPTTRLMYKKSINTVSKILDSRFLFLPLRKVDEHLNNAVLVAMMQNFGIDNDGNLIRLNDLSKKDTSKITPLWDAFTIDQKTGKVKIKGLNENNYIQFRNAVKETSGNIIGSLSQEDISRIDNSLVLNLMMQFKTWMPGIVRERTGDLIFDEHIQAVRWGRFRAAFSELFPNKGEMMTKKLTDREMEAGFKMNQFVGQIFIPNLLKASVDLLTFGGLRKVLGEDYTDSKGQTRRVRTNIERARRRYVQWITENPELQNKVTFDMFVEMKEGQLRAMLCELRTIMSFMMLLGFLAGDGDDDEPRYMNNYVSRTLFKALAKGNSELMFMWNPNEFIRLISNPLPLSSLLSSTVKTIGNTFDETRDKVFGENSPYDRTPVMYHTLQWAYGGAQLERFFELYESMKQNPYTLK